MNFKHDILPLKDKLFRMALRMTMQREEAEDVVQEVMIKLWNNRDNWHNIDNIESYAMIICRNLALDHLRKTSASLFVSTEDAQLAALNPQQNPYDRIYAKEQLHHIHQLLSQLPEKQRMCMHLRDFEGKNYKEIAEIMQVTEDQVKVNIFRARNFIKKNCMPV